ncbi:TonB family protein [Cognatiyoonia sp. IB215446]|uniref:energy transducer TonB family protein n=1 Tax=Cognatiyoonia sp. IB215446 TaxID=3097355 RepID=UPI002A16A947|nr:TonB family protein [Cognatiyoonia sp. IB215446]MDX8350493.1 TonB family protein [Cognatiyoonia sp. IB215446]
MIRSSAFVKAGVIVVSAALHVGLVVAFYEQPSVEIAVGTTGAINAQLGNSFADLVQGKQTPQIPAPALAAEMLPPAETAPSKSTQVTRPTETQPSPPAQMTTAIVAVPLATTAPTLPTLTPQTPTAQPETLAPVELETVTATTESAVETSRRPVARPQRPVQPPPGNSQQDAVAGSATGNTSATAPQQSGNTGQAATAGNAAASNYPGEVMQRITRIGRPRVRASGIAVVRFSIAANGGLAGVSIVQSSGSARLDRAAMQVIQRAAPFPPPPPGAKRSFSIRIEGRG